MNTIDPTKKYRTRDGRAVTGLRLIEDPDSDSPYTITGTVHEEDGDSCPETWTGDGIFLTSEPGERYDLVLAEDQEPEKPAPLLITPDPLRTEYGIFVAAVKCNYIAGTFAKAPPEQFDAWLESLTPILRS